MINLMRHGNAAQRARYLQPLVQGRSARASP
jgi:acyl-CoA dehydrogenase